MVMPLLVIVLVLQWVFLVGPLLLAFAPHLLPSLGWSLVGPFFSIGVRLMAGWGNASFSSGSGGFPRRILPPSIVDSIVGPGDDSHDDAPAFGALPSGSGGGTPSSGQPVAAPTTPSSGSSTDTTMATVASGGSSPSEVSSSGSEYMFPYFDAFVVGGHRLYRYPLRRFLDAFRDRSLEFFQRGENNSLFPMTGMQFFNLAIEAMMGGPVVGATLWGGFDLPRFSFFAGGTEERVIALGPSLSQIGAVVLLRRMTGSAMANRIVVEMRGPDAETDGLEQVVVRALGRLNTSHPGGGSSSSSLN